MNDTSVYKHKFASGKWNTEETDRPGPSLLSGAIAANAGLPPFKTAGIINGWTVQHLNLN